MNTENPALDISNWKYLDFHEVFLKIKKMTPKKFSIIWANDGSISPLDLYCYLKARYGNPNGLTMLPREDSTDNPIQWQYTLFSDNTMINFYGMNLRLEIQIASNNPIFYKDWKTFVKILKDDFKKFGPKMSKVRKSLEKWSLFINPFKRFNMIVNDIEKQLRDIDLREPTSLPAIITKKHQKKYFEELGKWHENINKARVIGASLRMIAPIFGESFINLIIFILAKKQIKSDIRLYEDLIRKNIDIRIKSLPLYCDGFNKDIKRNAEEFKQFITLMNYRNELLHGNVNPLKLKFDEVFFDKTIPLFLDEKRLSKRLVGSSIRYIEPEAALNDVRVVRDFIIFILLHLAPSFRREVEILMYEPVLGWREYTKRIGVLFSVPIVEFIPVYEKR